MLSCNALISRMSSEKSFVTILAAIRSQEKKRENGPLQEVLPVRSSHIRTMTLRASSCSPHKTELYLVPERRKSAGKMANCLGSQPGPLITTAQGNSILVSREQNRAASLDNLPRINQRRRVETYSLLALLGGFVSCDIVGALHCLLASSRSAS